ncbi:unnamed protein product [Amoebophrya sp. A120]|nr:unnamed protein product [Amoebophrya sp. A120]|eukprot:GSA120T00017932001.1
MPDLFVGNSKAVGPSAAKQVAADVDFAEEDDFEDIVDSGERDDDEDGHDLPVVGDLCRDDGGEDEDFCIGDTEAHTLADDQFDAIVGALEDIVVSDQFQKTMTDFCKTHCQSFADNEENKLEYTEIFSKWTKTIESYLELKLREAIDGFRMQDFLQLLGEREAKIEDEIVEEVLELLLSVNDFSTFKQLMLTHKQNGVTGGQELLRVTGGAATIHQDEDPDGDARPDLDFALCGKIK